MRSRASLLQRGNLGHLRNGAAGLQIPDDAELLAQSLVLDREELREVGSGTPDSAGEALGTTPVTT